MDSRPPPRPPMRPGETVPATASKETSTRTTATAGAASMRCSSAPTARPAGVESTSLPRTPKHAGLHTDPSSSSQQQPLQLQQQPVFCRICLDSDTEGLIAPCQCRGEGKFCLKNKSACASSHLFFLFSLLSAPDPVSLTFFLHAPRRALYITTSTTTSSENEKNNNQARSSTSTSRASESGSRSRASATAMVRKIFSLRWNDSSFTVLFALLFVSTAPS